MPIPMIDIGWHCILYICTSTVEYVLVLVHLHIHTLHNLDSPFVINSEIVALYPSKRFIINVLYLYIYLPGASQSLPSLQLLSITLPFSIPLYHDESPTQQRQDSSDLRH